ncbi:MAG TPA: SO2930 family diheme c-type cytochrome [Azospirillaceae bacterium]|nr:SO2930 family diheme c-type cytochrome [Azospirillaceae bacterium]
MRVAFRRAAAAAVLLAALAACREEGPRPTFHAEGNPDMLSAWGVVAVKDGRLALAEGVLPYDLASPLFTDYAGKLRTVWMPEGKAAAYHPTEAFDFPVGTVITKTFWYPTGGGKVLPVSAAPQSGAEGLDLKAVRMVETRVLVRREAGWTALPYVWNEEQTEARLARTGAVVPLTLARDGQEDATFSYVVPNANQCAGCHTPDHVGRAVMPIGPKARHMNRDFPYADGTRNQLVRFAEAGYLTGAPAPEQAPRNADWTDPAAPLDARARAYLDANCGHCHSVKGAAKTSGLYLDAGVTDWRELGLCKPPVAAGQGTGDRKFDLVPGKPDESILVYRMDSDKPAVMMPELGRSLIHGEGVELIRAWIAAREGGCG